MARSRDVVTNFQPTTDVLANPWRDVLIYDVESWMVWKGVWETFVRDGVLKTDNQILYNMQRFQSKFKHLWDAAERSVRSADGPMGLMAIAPLETPQEPHPRPLEQALLASPGEVHSRTATGQREMLQSEKSGVQASKGSIVAAQSMQK
ncbi:hypothetical protein WJX77_000544 [Trebouxia sp. C0004]